MKKTIGFRITSALVAAILLLTFVSCNDKKVKNNSLDLGIKIDFQPDSAINSNGTYHDGYSSVSDYPLDNDTDSDAIVYASCEPTAFGKVLIDGQTLNNLAIIEKDIFLRNLMSKQTVTCYEFIMLHELGHALGLSHPDGSSIKKPADFFKNESVMADDSVTINYDLVNGHVAYYTIDAAALRMLYKSDP